MNLWIIFLTGLTSGGVSCAAVQGGLLASAIASQKQHELKSGQTAAHQKFDLHDWLPATSFLTTKLLAHVLLGATLGLLGSALTLSKTAALIFQTAAALFMLGSALNLLNVHPLFRWFALQPPKALFKWLRVTSKHESLIAPAVLGFFTIFIPCGVTQAMEVLAITSQSSIQGALIMGTFVLGTLPLFLLIGVITARFSELWRTRFLRIAAALLIFLALSSLNGVLVALDSPISVQKMGNALSEIGKPPAWYGGGVQTGTQVLQLNVTSSGYEPRKLRAAAGQPVELHLVTNKAYSCALAFTLPAFDIEEMLEPTGERVVTFTPTKPGKYIYTCSMGMYTGTLEVY